MEWVDRRRGWVLHKQACDGLACGLEGPDVPCRPTTLTAARGGVLSPWGNPSDGEGPCHGAGRPCGGAAEKRLGCQAVAVAVAVAVVVAATEGRPRLPHASARQPRRR